MTLLSIHGMLMSCRNYGSRYGHRVSCDWRCRVIIILYIIFPHVPDGLMSWLILT